MQNPHSESAAADRTVTKPASAGSTAPQRDIATLDAAALAGLRELDPHGLNRLLERVVRAFQNSLDRLMPQLLDSQAKRDAAGLRHVAHTLKSSSASIGALRLSTLCGELENAVRGGAADGLDARIDELRAEVECVRPALEQLLPNA
jgi:two-component system, sensor histidine kinase and response regulator